MAEQFKVPESERFARLTELNKTSRYMTDVDRPFSVTMSVASAGRPREMYNVYENPDAEVVAAKKAANRLISYPIPGNRFVLAGNMSPAVNPIGKEHYGSKDLPSEMRPDSAREAMLGYLESQDIDPADVRVLRPDRDYKTPLQVVNIDQDPAAYNGKEPTTLEGMGDMIYTYNPNVVFGVRPADCPLVVASADTPKGRVYTLVHFAWRGAANDQMSEMASAFDELGMDLSTATVYVTPGGQAETFPFTSNQDLDEQYPKAGGLFDFKKEYDKDAEHKYDFTIDTPHFVYEGLRSMGLNEDQIFVDTSDTTSPASGYSSHSRSARLDDDNMRDFVTVKLNTSESLVGSNPERPTPSEVEWQIAPLEVEYIDFEGKTQVGTIEVNRELYDDVKDFFVLAKHLEFPIEHVVKSSDPEYAWDDNELMAANTSSGFNYRLIKGTEKPSLHGLGRAFDVNTRLNPYIRHNADGTESVDPEGAVYDTSLPGVLTADHELVIFMKDRGWEWGGDWTKESGRTDYQHFQKAED